MNAGKKIAISAIESQADICCEISDKVWEYAELSLQEYQSAALYVEELKKLGFEVEAGFDGIQTAFTAKYGHGKPVIGILGEFDALTGLSQQGCCAERKQVVDGGNGHGCGHNMLGAGAMAAAIGVKAYLEQTGHEGTVIFYGCPGEEGGASKAFFARDGVWKDLDAALSWHPGSTNEVSTGTCVSCIQTEYKFTGIAAHAAGSPHLGRSALDAVELMNIGVQFLREHMPETARIHYAITDAGGISPNVVQPVAQVLYMVRAVQVQEAMELQKRVDKIAQAAAMMTDTTVKQKFIDGTANLVPNFTMEEMLYRNFEEIGVPTYTDEEMAYAQSLVDTYENPSHEIPGFGSKYDPDIAEFAAEKSANGTKPMNDFLLPLYHGTANRPGSTDVGDVSWLTPTAQIRTACFAAGAPGHSWQNVSIGKSSIGHKGLIHAGKVLAMTAIDLFEQPEQLEKAKAEFAKRAKAGYTCPVPKDAVPTIAGEKF